MIILMVLLDFFVIQKKGFGKFYHITGDIYEGEWYNGKANGKGTYFVNNGIIYKGN